jgi:tripartite-type tricarboxylate transporter receptor subunit TctC
MLQHVTRRAVLTIPALAGAAQAQPAWAPDRPIRIVVPYTAGGASDVTARLIGERLRARLGQPGIVENRPGASGIIGTEAVARSRPDGQTLAFVASSHVVNGAIFTSLPYDPIRDFAPVIQATTVQLVMVVPSSHPASTVAEFLAWARAQDGRAAYASSGNGSNPHLAAADLLRRVGIRMEHVPYRGSTAAHADLIAGRTAMMFDAYAAVQPHVEANTLRMLAVAGAEPSRLLPGVPTVADAAGVPGYAAPSWGCLLAPANTPSAVVEALNAAVSAILAGDDVRERLAALGAEPVGGTPGALLNLMQQEQDRLVALASALGIKESI